MSISFCIRLNKKKVEPGQYILKLSNLGLGQDQDGILSYLKTEDYASYAEQISNAVTDIEDNNHISCIDGRKTVCQINGAKEVTRARIAGGILSYNIAALLSKGSLSQSLSTNDSIYERMYEIEKFANDTIGIKCSSHVGGCGAANGLIDHLHAINTEFLSKGTQAVFDLVGAGFKSSYDEGLYGDIAENAKSLASELEAADWDGNEFVDLVSKEEPNGVEQLESDDDHTFNGHMEQAIIVVKGNKTISKKKMLELGLGQAFVVNIDLINDIAVSLSGLEGHKGYSKALHSLIAYQMAVANNLCNKNMPIFVV